MMNGGRRLKILVVDDHFVVRQGLKGILAEHRPDAEFGEASNAQEALDLAWKESWDLVLLDISMPGRGGLDVLKDLRQSLPKLPVIVMSMHPEEQFAIRVLKLGASSYIRKDSAGHELIKGVDAALRGAKYINPSIAQQLAENLECDHEGPSHLSLSDGEYQVLCLLASGKTVKEVGNELSLNIKTISTYRSRILEKLNLRNNSQLMRYALRHRLIDTEG
ncbi:MAG: two-component system, NarL family, invasion response regulator UvrY [Chthoniobacter sp.]|jgi:DNA-binding NarL/FixJ family response regulator|nr:two-component system, NarL family, invasion response regulator UvrY [Chthoniobacter sp.]